MDSLTTVCLENQVVINVRFGQNNTMFMFNLAPMCDLYAYTLYSQKRDNAEEDKKCNNSAYCRYTRK